MFGAKKIDAHTADLGERRTAYDPNIQIAARFQQTEAVGRRRRRIYDEASRKMRKHKRIHRMIVMQMRKYERVDGARINDLQQLGQRSRSEIDNYPAACAFYQLTARGFALRGH